MLEAAIIRVRRPSGALDTFRADLCRVEAGFITATGRWKGSRRLVAYTWPTGVVVEVRWRSREPVSA